MAGGTDTSQWGAGQQLIPGPPGKDGPPGPMATLTIGVVTQGIEPAASIVQTGQGQYILNLTLPQGNKGDKGDTGKQGDKGDTGADGVVQSVVSGSGIEVDSTDPANPEVAIESTVTQAINEKLTEILAGTGITVDTENQGTPTSPRISILSTYAPVFGYIESSDDDPTTTDIIDGTYKLWFNTQLSELKLWANIGDVMYTVELTQ